MSSEVMSPDLVRAIQEQYQKFLNLINDPLYRVNQHNFDKLVEWIRSQGIPEQNWFADIFSSAYIVQRAAGVLEFDPPPKTAEQLRTARIIKDQFNSSQTREDRMHFQSQKEKDDAEFAKSQEKRAAKAAAEAAAVDFSQIPRWQAMVENPALLFTNLNAQQIRAMSSQQTKEYIFRSGRAQQELDFQRGQAKLLNERLKVSK
jgi:hypothetical protein